MYFYACLCWLMSIFVYCTCLCLYLREFVCVDVPVCFFYRVVWVCLCVIVCVYICVQVLYVRLHLCVHALVCTCTWACRGPRCVLNFDNLVFKNCAF